MALGGLWHGAAITFIAWGLFHGVGQAVERRISRRGEGPNAPDAAPPAGWRQWLGRLLTFHFVCVGWVLFRSDSFGTAVAVLRRAATAGGGVGPLVTPNLMLVIAGALAMQYFPVGIGRRIQAAFAEPPLVVQGAVMGVVIALIFALGPKGVAPFIYYQF